MKFKKLNHINPIVVSRKNFFKPPGYRKPWKYSSLFSELTLSGGYEYRSPSMAVDTMPEELAKATSTKGLTHITNDIHAFNVVPYTTGDYLPFYRLLIHIEKRDRHLRTDEARTIRCTVDYVDVKKINKGGWQLSL